MSTSLKQIEEQAQALSAEDIEQRIAAFDRGEISAYPAEDVFADARRISR